eukprot:6139045-Amphidinium_carterae.1
MPAHSEGHVVHLGVPDAASHFAVHAVLARAGNIRGKGAGWVIVHVFDCQRHRLFGRGDHLEVSIDML